MSHRIRLTLITILVITTLACQAVTRVLDFSPSATFVPTAIIPTPIPTSSPTLTPVPLPTATFTLEPSPTLAPTDTPIPDTATPETSPVLASPNPLTPSPTPLPLALQQKIFEELWKTVNEEYLYPDFNGLDWNAIHVEYLKRIEAGLSNAEFYAAMDEIIVRLNDNHSVFLSPEQVKAEESEYAGHQDFVGVGVMALPVPERKRAVILVVFPNSPAEQAGLKSHDSILAADGQAILDANGAIRDIIRGPEDTSVTLTVQTSGESPRDITLRRQRITGPIPVPYTVLTSPNGKRIGYILIITFGDSTINGQVGDAIKAMSKTAALDGLIIDDRPNDGGYSTVLEGMLAYFTSGTLGHFVSRKETRPLQVKAQNVSGSQNMPLVVLISQNTVSYGEVFAGVLKDIGRAYMIGQTTAGNVETLWGYDFEDGSRAWIAREAFRPLKHPDQKWEGVGIIPDLEISVNWDEVTLETDPAVNAALAHFDK